MSPKNSGDFSADSLSLGKKHRTQDENESRVKYNTGTKNNKGMKSVNEDIEKL